LDWLDVYEKRNTPADQIRAGAGGWVNSRPRRRGASSWPYSRPGWLGLARLEPLVVVFEDLHWMDPSTLEIVTQTAKTGAITPLLLLPWFTEGSDTGDLRDTGALLDELDP
jgi:hypothetical protein